MNTTEKTMTDLTNTEITDIIGKDENFKKILNCYKTTLTSAHISKIDYEYHNGLTNTLYFILLDNKLTSILLPIYTQSKTITWDLWYLKDIRKQLPVEFSHLEDHELVDLIKCPLYYVDKHTNDVDFLAYMINLKDFIANGFKGKSGHSVYYVKDNLPKNLNITLKYLKSEIFIKTLPIYSNKELKDICSEFALKFYKKFHDVTVRTEQTKIKNIAYGLYAQFKTYLYLLETGNKVTMEWLDGDDLGIDIVYTINSKNINIDVKSTKSKELKITKNRAETDFYAVCTWKKDEPQLLGFLYKFNFWKSDIINTTLPTKKDDMYMKSIEQITPDLVSIDQIYQVLYNYSKEKIKHKQRLFNEE